MPKTYSHKSISYVDHPFVYTIFIIDGNRIPCLASFAERLSGAQSLISTVMKIPTSIFQHFSIQYKKEAKIYLEIVLEK